MKSLHHSFDVELAAQYGIEPAILIHHFQHWIKYNKTLGRNFKEGRTWTYQTRKEIAAHFPYWTENQIRRYIDKLVECRVIVKGNFNKSLMDNTIWYAFADEEKFTSGYSAHRSDQEETPSGELAQPIPHTKTTESKPNTKQGNAYEQGLPFPKKDHMGAKYPLKNSQMPLFNWLKSQNIGSPDETLMYYVRVYTEQKIREAVKFMYDEIRSGAQIQKPGAFFRKVLDGSIIMKTEESVGNKGVASKFINDNNWKTVVVNEKYLKDSVTGDDLQFSMQPDMFQRSLKTLYEKSMMYAE